MNKPIQIYIDTSGKAHVSYECDEGQYLCPDCYSQQLADQKYIHDWLIFVDDANPLECRIAIHKDVVHPDRIDDADCSSPDPDDDISRFGPGTSVYTLLSLIHI